MALMADPIFYHAIRRNAGGKRRLVHVTNSDPVDVEFTVKEVEKPEWVEIEGIYPGVTLKFERGKRTPFVVNLNTEHSYFPTGSSMDEKVRVIFEEKRVLDIGISLPKIVDKIMPFRGVFSIDYGTTNSVYGYKGRAMDMPHHAQVSQGAEASAEIPSAIFFHNVENRKAPRFSIGSEALFDIKENSSRTYSYILSAKRRLGQDRKLMILDRMAGAKKEHRQEYHYQEIASFIIRDLIQRTEEDIGQKITSVVATYPPMFSRTQKEALENAFRKALEYMGIDPNEEGALVMDLDEANAGAFNYIYGPILDEFRDFQVTERKLDLLSLDFGGGTVDISFVSVEVTRNQQGRITIDTELRGLSGERNWGGDNVTLATFKMLKTAVALAAGSSRAEAISQKQALSVGDGGAEEDSLWGDGGGGAADEDIWGAGAGGDSEGKAVEEDPEVAEIVNREPAEAYEASLVTLANEKAVIQAMISRDLSASDAVIDIEKADGTYSGDEAAQQRATIVESAIETVVPTQYTNYEDVDPFKVELARSIFHELWHEADLLKIRMSSSMNGQGKVTGVLKKVAKYAGVDAIVFNDVEFKIDELNARIGPVVEKIVDKACKIYESVQGDQTEGLTLVGEQSERPPLRVLLLGNCASLPLVRQSVNDAFGAEGQTVIFERKNLKRAVACGAAEEYSLRKEFGEKGLITYNPKGFLDRLPYAIGIQHRDLALMGYPNGFCAIFDRGARVGSATVLDDSSAFLIHEKMKDLAIFADYKDGGDPVYLGWIDFTEEASPEKIPVRPETAVRPEKTVILQAMTASPEGSFGVKFELLGNREILATNLNTRTCHILKPETEEWDTSRDSFSGVH